MLVSVLIDLKNVNVSQIKPFSHRGYWPLSVESMWRWPWISTLSLDAQSRAFCSCVLIQTPMSLSLVLLVTCHHSALIGWVDPALSTFRGEQQHLWDVQNHWKYVLYLCACAHACVNRPPTQYSPALMKYGGAAGCPSLSLFLVPLLLLSSLLSFLLGERRWHSFTHLSSIYVSLYVASRVWNVVPS